MAKRVIKDYPQISIRLQNLTGKIDFGDIFGHCAPVHIEIGSGKGTFLVSQAGAMSEINFLGIEWANKYCRYAVDRIGRWGITNVRMIRTDAGDFLCEHLPDDSVDCFHIYFPDPWPKKRHHKRRFICSENMLNMLRCLKIGGIINIATDHEGYFEQVKEVIDAELEGKNVEIVDFILAAGAENGEAVGTNYERKYIKDNRNIHKIAIKKRK